MNVNIIKSKYNLNLKKEKKRNIMHSLAKEFSLYKWNREHSDKCSPASDPRCSGCPPYPWPQSATAIVLKTLYAHTGTHVHMSSFYISKIRLYILGGI